MRAKNVLTALAVFLMAGLTGPAMHTFASSDNGESADSTVALHLLQNIPEIRRAQLKGKKLIVEGDNFDAGAVVYINGEQQKTKRKANGILIAKKAVRRILPEEINSIHVQNTNGALSDKFDFFSGLTITLEDSGKTIPLKTGEKVLLALDSTIYSWTLHLSNEVILERTDDTPPGTQGIFEAKQAGQVRLSALGELPCHKSTPPCEAASPLFEVSIDVQ